MFYKLFKYVLERREEALDPSGHLRLFQLSIGRDKDGQFAEYRRQQSVLMHINVYETGFTGLIGKHSTEREITEYEERRDRTRKVVVTDDDYPNTPFIALPSLEMIACVDSRQIDAHSAMRRLHAIIAHRTDCFFIYHPLRQIDDLRFAIQNFKVTEVDYEVLPVNPHSDDLGRELDERRKKDFIDRLVGRIIGTKKKPLALNGGFLTEIQQLQASGHSRVGYTGYTPDDIEIKLSKPKEPYEHEEEYSTEKLTKEIPELRISFKGVPVEYPFNEGHLQQMMAIMKIFHKPQLDSEN